MESIVEITKKGNIKTFNWFCDDTWRFDTFSTIACQYFNVCSTPEPKYVDKYKNIGYNNIIVGGWHTNQKFYPTENHEKKYDVSFIGQLNNPDRIGYIKYLRDNGISVHNFHGLSHSEMTKVWSETKIGLNFRVVTNKKIGATSEEWFKLKGTPLVQKMREKRLQIPEIVLKYLA